MSMNGNQKDWYHFSRWLPETIKEDGKVIELGDDLNSWIIHFRECGIKTELRMKGGKVALYREGSDSFQSDGQD